MLENTTDRETRSTIPPRIRLLFAAGALVEALPWIGLSALLVYGLGSLFGRWAAVEVLAGWLLLGPLYFCLVNPIALLGAGGRVRRPTEDENAVLGAVWSELADRTGIDAADYALRVQDSDQGSAYAAAVRGLVVSSSALRRLTPNQLAAVLAHELGHHLMGRLTIRTRIRWYALPAAILSAVWVRAVIRGRPVFGRLPLGLARTVSAACMLAGLPAVALAMRGVIGLPVAIALAVLLALEPFATLWVGRREEYSADRVAVDLGYGRDLAEHLAGSPVPSEPPGGLSGLLDRHPSHAARIRAIEARLRVLGS